MKQLTILLTAFLFAAPVMAQVAEPAPGSEIDEGASLMQKGAELLLRGLLSEMEPALDEMSRGLSEIEPKLREMEPAIRQLFALIDDLGNYSAPEMLENGDIIMRRKPDTPLPPVEPSSPQIDL